MSVFFASGHYDVCFTNITLFLMTRLWHADIPASTVCFMLDNPPFLFSNLVS